MHVKIGPYIHHWSTHETFNDWLEWRHGKYSWEVKDKDHTRLDHVVEWILDRWQTVLNLTVNQIQQRRERIQKIKIDKYDTWSMDSTLSPIIYPMLVQLKATQHGACHVDDDDVPEELKSTSAPKVNPENGETDDNHFKRWDYVLSEMIWAFGTLADPDWEDQFHTGNIDILWTPVDIKGKVIPDDDDAELFKMGKGPKDTHVFDIEGRKKFDKRIANGTRLFGKYYLSLWD